MDTCCLRCLPPYPDLKTFMTDELFNEIVDELSTPDLPSLTNAVTIRSELLGSLTVEDTCSSKAAQSAVAQPLVRTDITEPVAIAVCIGVFLIATVVITAFLVKKFPKLRSVCCFLSCGQKQHGRQKSEVRSFISDPNNETCSPSALECDPTIFSVSKGLIWVPNFSREKSANVGGFGGESTDYTMSRGVKGQQPNNFGSYLSLEEDLIVINNSIMNDLNIRHSQISERNLVRNVESMLDQLPIRKNQDDETKADGEKRGKEKTNSAIGDAVLDGGDKTNFRENIKDMKMGTVFNKDDMSSDNANGVGKSESSNMMKIAEVGSEVDHTKRIFSNASNYHQLKPQTAELVLDQTNVMVSKDNSTTQQPETTADVVNVVQQAVKSAVPPKVAPKPTSLLQSNTLSRATGEPSNPAVPIPKFSGPSKLPLNPQLPETLKLRASASAGAVDSAANDNQRDGNSEDCKACVRTLTSLFEQKSL